jgi:hypothetical protein
MIRFKPYFLIVLILGSFIISSCKNDAEPDVKLPGIYLPAYPGSYWDYSDGTRSRVESQYQEHSYRASTNSTSYTETYLVPVIDGQYLYEYSVYQLSTIYPLRKLLDITPKQSWIVEENNEVKVERYSGHLDSLVVAYPNKDSVFKSVVTSVEYIDSLGEDRWNRKEYYAKNVGLIRVDINDPFDTLPPVIQKEIRTYYINK